MKGETAMKYDEWFKGILAGLMISIGCTVFLSVGGIVGSILFSVGLLGVVTYGLDLYTGKSGFLPIDANGFRKLFSILVFNSIGVIVSAYLMSRIHPEFSVKCTELIMGRVDSGLARVLVASIGCGIMMSLAISGVKKNNYLPLLFAVPCFILSGFYHSIADLFYFMVSDVRVSNYIVVWIVTVIGNWIGCNVHRLIEQKPRTN